jgi:ABC-2 type transport system permease protein
MNAAWTIWARESRAAWLGGRGWALAALFTCCVGAIFAAVLRAHDGGFWQVHASWAAVSAGVLPFLAAAATMRLFAGERQAGTLDLLLSSPLSDRDLVLGKYSASLGVVAVSLCAGAAPLVALGRISGVRVWPDAAGAAGAALFLLLQATVWTALGTLCSTLTRRPAAAMVLTLLAGGAAVGAWSLLVLLVPALHLRLPALPVTLGLLDFAAGRLSTAVIVTHVAAVAFLLFASVRSMEMRRW